MGKWTAAGCERELSLKIRNIFDEIDEKLRKESEEYHPIPFEEFVNMLDSKDRFNKRLFEFLIKVPVIVYNRKLA